MVVATGVASVSLLETVAEPVVTSDDESGPGRGRQNVTQTYWSNREERSTLRPLLPERAVDFTENHGLRPAKPGLHPWLQSSAPRGASVRLKETNVKLRTLTSRHEPL